MAGGKKKRPKKFISPFEGHLDGPKWLIIKRTDYDSCFDSEAITTLAKGIKKNCNITISGFQRYPRNLLLLQVDDIEQANKVLRLTKVGNMVMEITPHYSMNSCRTVVSDRELRDEPLETLEAAFQSQGVRSIKPIMRKRKNELYNTNTFVVTFNTATPPETLQYNGRELRVTLYVPLPFYCHFCQRYGHVAKFCREPEVCSNCCKEDHLVKQCTNPTRCRSCGSYSHPSWSKSCKRFELEQQAQYLMVTENIPMAEARTRLNLPKPYVKESHGSCQTGECCSSC